VLIELWLTAGAVDEARRVARELLAMAPEQAHEVYKKLGGEKLGLGHLMEATPNTPEAADRLARHLRQRGDLTGAQIVLERALLRHPGEPRLSAALAGVLLARGDEKEALATIQAVDGSQAPGVRRQALRLRIRALLREGRHEDLEAALRELERLGGDPWRIALSRARSLAAQGRHEEGEAVLRQALQATDPSRGPRARLVILVELGRSLSRRGEVRRALDVFREARTIDPGHPAVRRFFARLDRAAPPVK
jgi:tetratricopeptide (TPR) repeat protein